MGLIAAESGDSACNPVDSACAVKSKPTSLSLNHQWVLGFVGACGVRFWVIWKVWVNFEGFGLV